MRLRRQRKIVVAVVLALLLAAIAAAYVDYRATKSFKLDFSGASTTALRPPQFLFSFSGDGSSRLQQPTGVAVSAGRVYVADSRLGAVVVFDQRGKRLTSFGKGKLTVPLWIAIHPKTGEIWVTDRRSRTLSVFKPDGTFVRVFAPKLPKNQLPAFDTGGVQWAPIGVAFAPDGRMYVTDVLTGHRLLVFGADGTFKKSSGTVGMVETPKEGPELFQFPNGVAVHGDEVFVVDSNNRRIQVFDLSGTFKRLLPTAGLPRGVAFLPAIRGLESTSTPRLVVVDTLAHDATIWSADGEKLVIFGEQGVLEGQFSYPNGIAVDASGRMFIADTQNGRIEVWGWPNALRPVPLPTSPNQLAYLLLPLLLLPFWLRRRKPVYATPDFIATLAASGQLAALKARPRTRWQVAEEHEADTAKVVGDAADIEYIAHSDSDVASMIERFELDRSMAIDIANAQRARLFCTQDVELRRLAKLQGIDVMNVVEYLERWGSRSDR